MFADDFWFTAPSDTNGFFATVSSGGGSALTGASFSPNNASLFWSPGSVAFDGGGHALTTDNGTYLKTSFSGTRIGMNLDVSLLSAAGISNSLWPHWIVSIDGGAPSLVTVSAPSSGSISGVPLASGLSSGSHTLECWYELNDESNTWTPADAYVIQSIVLDSGASLSAPSGVAALRSKRALILGDSITKGFDATNSSSLGNYPPLTFAQVLLRALDAEGGQVGKSGQGWLHPGTGGVTGGLAFPATWNFVSEGRARSLSGLDFLIVAHGANDTSDVTTAVSNWLPVARAAVGTSCWILLLTPFSPNARTNEIKSAVATYLASHTSDTKAAAIDLSTVAPLTPLGGSGTPDLLKFDGIHPNTLGHVWIGATLGGMISRLVAAGSGGTSSGGSTSTLDLNQVLGSGAWAGATVGDALKAAWIQGKGRWSISGSHLVLYAPDGVTVEKTFTLNSPTSPTERS